MEGPINLRIRFDYIIIILYFFNKSIVMKPEIERENNKRELGFSEEKERERERGDSDIQLI